MSKFHLFPVTIFLLLLFSSNLWAFKLTPMSSEVKALGKEARTTFQVENDSDISVPVQVTLAKRIVDENGKEKYPPAGDDFMVFPTQLILAPKEKRSINIRYMGGTKSEHKVERAFRVIAEQLPLPLKDKKQNAGAGINVLLRYIAALYVVPEEITKKIEVVGLQVTKGQLKVRLKNSGSVHEILEHYEMKISGVLNGAKIKKILSGSKDLKGLFGENILADHERVFIVNFPDATKIKDLKVEMIQGSKKE